MMWELDELPNVRDEIAWLPQDPLDVLGEELSRQVADEALWPAYLERLALEVQADRECSCGAIATRAAATARRSPWPIAWPCASCSNGC